MIMKSRSMALKLASICFVSLSLTVAGLSAPKKGGGKSNPESMQSRHFSVNTDLQSLAIRPQEGLDQGSGVLYLDGETGDPSDEFGISITLDGGVYNMTMQCPMGYEACNKAFDISLALRTTDDPPQPESCPLAINMGTSRMTIWVQDLRPWEAPCDPQVSSADCTYSSTARAQIRQLDELGGVLQGGIGAELNWDPALGGLTSTVDITPQENGWDIEGYDAVILSGKGRNKTSCLFDASFRLNTAPSN